MKKIVIMTIGAVLALGPCAVAQNSAAGKAAALYKQGLRAVEQGQVETARTCFEEVIRLQPRHINARYQLKQLSLTSGSLAATRRENSMKAVNLPAVDFEGLTLPEAVEAINALVEKETKKQFTPNFIVQDPTGAFATRKITLKLGGLPASQVLKYCLESARATARYDAHAIVIRPLGVEKGAPAVEGRDEQAVKEPAGKGSRDPFVR